MRLNNIVIRFIAYGKEFSKRIPLLGALSTSQLSLSIFLKIQTFANHAKSQRAIFNRREDFPNRRNRQDSCKSSMNFGEGIVSRMFFIGYHLTCVPPIKG